MSICPACNGTGPLGAVLGVVCGRCDGSGEVCDAAAQAKTKGGETMNDEMMAHTFVVESMTVEAGRIIPSPALAEAVIGGIAQIIAERDELKAQLADVPWDALMELVAAARQNTDAMYKLSTWNAAINACEWVNANAPKPRP